MTGLGNLLLAFAALASIVAIGALWWGDRLGQKAGESTTNAGYLATFGVLLFTGAAVALLMTAFLTNNYTFQYVAENHTTDVSGLRWLYQISGVWAGREGSLLFWEFLVACFAAFVAYKRMQVTDRLSNIGLAVTNVIQFLFLLALFIEKNNPFQTSPAEFFNAQGQLAINAAMNPLLQHWAMILHPPTLFIGYAGMTIPFAFAVAALILGDSDRKWVDIVSRPAVFAWLFLGIGIGLGAIWAYVVLGWGGYWAWDPVENASLLPWLTGVGLVHSFTVYRRRDGFKGWAVVMATVSFVFVILATFITRSGVVESVHAFEKDPLSLYLFLSMMVGALVVGLGGLFLRREEFRAADEFESLASKDAAYYFNNVLMLVAGIIVALLTLSPAIFGLKWGPGNYQAIAKPVGIAYVAIMVACPILSWRKTAPDVFWSRMKGTVIGGALLSVALLAVWWTQLWPYRAQGWKDAVPADRMLWAPESVIALVVASFAIVMPLYLFWTGARTRAAGKGTSVGSALLHILTKSRTQSGGYLAHLGIGIILVGLVGSAMFVQDTQAVVKQQPGSTFQAGGYTFSFAKMEQNQLANGDVLTRARFDLKRGNAAAGQVGPAELLNAVNQQATRDVAIIHEPLRDVFVVLEGVKQDGSLQISAKVNPLITFTWVGFVLLVLGMTLAVWPKSRAAAA